MSTSQWSNSISFNTQVSYIPTNEQALLIPIDLKANAYFGECLALDTTGTRLIVGAHQMNVNPITNCGLAYIYLRTGSSWSLEMSIAAPDRSSNDILGRSVAINGSGSRVAIGAPRHTYNSVYESGAAYVWVRSGTWNQETKLGASDKAANAFFGWGSAISKDATKVAFGAYAANYSSYPGLGKAYVFA